MVKDNLAQMIIDHEKFLLNTDYIFFIFIAKKLHGLDKLM